MIKRRAECVCACACACPTQSQHTAKIALMLVPLPPSHVDPMLNACQTMSPSNEDYVHVRVFLRVAEYQRPLCININCTKANVLTLLGAKT